MFNNNSPAAIQNFLWNIFSFYATCQIDHCGLSSHRQNQVINLQFALSYSLSPPDGVDNSKLDEGEEDEAGAGQEPDVKEFDVGHLRANKRNY